MAMAHFDVSLAYDQVVKRAVPGQVARVSHPETDIPYSELLDLNGNPIAALVSNSQGYVQPFQIQDGPPFVKLSIGSVTYYLVDLNSVGAASTAAQEAAEAAQRAADLVEAPADEVVALLAQNPATETYSALDATTGLLIDQDGSALQGAADARYPKRGENEINIKDFGAKGDGTTDDTAAWNAFQAASGVVKVIPAGQYLVGGVIRRFDNGVIGNGVFDDATASWDQPMGDRERNSILVHRNDINANTTLVSPVIKTQTHVTFEVDNPGPASFKHVIGAYHEGTLDGYYNISTDTNQNFTVFGSTSFNRMAGLFGSLAHLAYVKDATEEENPLIETMGATKNGCSFLQFTRRAKYANGGYMFGLEVYAQNMANETTPVPYQNNDEFSFTAWTSGIKVGGNGSGAPISAAMFTHGLSSSSGFWNGIVLGGSSFTINGENQGVAGTVALNLASHRTSNGFADIGIKFRTNNRHLYFREGAKIRSSHTRFMYAEGTSGVSIDSGPGGESYLNFRSEVTTAADGGAVVTRATINANSSRILINGTGAASEVLLSPANGAALYAATSARFAPGTANDGLLHLGGPTRRWNTVYATTGTIDTSDERAKTDIDNIPDAVLDAWGRVNFQQYRLNDAIAIKGFGRLHTGVVAQRVVEAFEAEGLDATEYGLLCYDEWEAEPEKVHEYSFVTKEAVYERVLIKDAVFEEVQLDDGTTETREVSSAEYGDGELLEPEVVETRRDVTPAVEAGSIFGIRYEEALILEAAFQRRRSDRLEARIERLESLLVD